MANFESGTINHSDTSPSFKFYPEILPSDKFATNYFRQTVLVWALDRLSREGALAIWSLVQKLSACGVKVLSYQESWTEAPGELAEFLYALTGWVAKMESQRRSERTKAGLARVKAQGKCLGRPPGSKDKRKRRRRPRFTAL